MGGRGGQTMFWGHLALSPLQAMGVLWAVYKVESSTRTSPSEAYPDGRL